MSVGWSPARVDVHARCRTAVRRAASASSPTIPVDVGRTGVRRAGSSTRPAHHLMTSRPPAEDQRPAETTAATGDQWVIGHGHQRAVITEVGSHPPLVHRRGPSGDRGFRADRVEPRGTGPGARPLAQPPRGRYATPSKGSTPRPPLDEPAAGNAIHGLVRWMPWRMVGRAQNRVSMACELRPSPGLPLRPPALTIEYRLGRDGLVVTASTPRTSGLAPPVRDSASTRT